MSQSLKILVIDQEIKYSSKLTAFIEKKFNCFTKTINNGRDGFIEIVNSRPRYDLIICDSEAPGMNGFGLLNSLKRDKSFLKIPFLMTTPKGDYEQVKKEKALEMGAEGFFVKGVSEKEVEGIVAHVMDLARIRKRERYILVSGLDGGNLADFVSKSGNLQLASVEISIDTMNLIQQFSTGPQLVPGWERTDAAKPVWSLWVNIIDKQNFNLEDLLKRRKIMRTDYRYRDLPVLLLHPAKSEVIKDFRKKIITDELFETYKWPCTFQELASVIATLFSGGDHAVYEKNFALDDAESRLEKGQYHNVEKFLRSLEGTGDEFRRIRLLTETLLKLNKVEEALMEIENLLHIVFSKWKGRSLIGEVDMTTEETKYLNWITIEVIRLCAGGELKKRGRRMLLPAVEMVSGNPKIAQTFLKAFETLE